ncbi:unnamed protein product [Rhizophagus irregularis]|nr:unnamed protein product [Rhizophagus irregularis]
MLSQNDIICKSCNKIYENIDHKWCRQCVINNLKKNFTNWTSGNVKIDNFIQKMQLEIKKYDDIIVEWIPYNQFNNVKKTNKDGFTTAIWKDGLLKYDKKERKRKRLSNIEVFLKCLNNSQNVINEFSNEVKTYSIKDDEYKITKIYGISQNPDTNDYIIVLNNNYCEVCGKIYTNVRGKWCKPCQINNLKQNFTNWTSGNKIIDEFIQEMQLKIKRYDDIIVEWIPYNQFNTIKEVSFSKAYLAIWKNGSLKYNGKNYERESNKKVTLKCLNNSQNVISDLLNEAKAYSIKNNKYKIPIMCGISQNPDTNDYIIVLENNSCCKECGEIYAVVWRKWCKPCQINKLKQNFTNWTSGNKIIDEFIQEMQLKIKRYDDIIIEWIPYNQFNTIKKISFSKAYLAIWKNGSLKYIGEEINYVRVTNEKVTLKCLNSSQNVISDLLNEQAKTYSIKVDECNIPTIYGISQNSDTNDYIIVLNNSYCKECGKIYTDIRVKWCKPCQINGLKQNFVNWTSGNEKIDNFIQKMQLKINNYDDIIVEWIPYNQFDTIKEISFFKAYLAIWKNGSLEYNYEEIKYERKPNKEVTLKCLNNSQNVISGLLNEAKAYSIDELGEYNIPKIYGITQNPDTNDYTIVLNNSYCEECGNIYTDIGAKWCKPCQINGLKQNFVN